MSSGTGCELECAVYSAGSLNPLNTPINAVSKYQVCQGHHCQVTAGIGNQ
jgi:hypothetical protein